ncbi:hypothetical protein ACFWNN_44680 [Lentzea sp. NPDC058450]|uniref:hypothetical protein n=1 Tax=Lentzea sp. NPDC058450 TaxID=3346505 RepID=UPI003659A15E
MTMTLNHWSDRARLELGLLGVDAALADQVLAEVREHCAESGESPEEAFGTPAHFAATVMDERMPLADRALRDRSGTTVFEAWSAVIGRVGMITAIAGVFAWIKQGLILPLTPAGLTGSLLVYAALLSVLYAGNIARLIGRPRTVVPAWIAAAVLVVPAATAFVMLPRDAIASVPSPFLLVAGALLIWWSFARENATDVAKATEGAEEWLGELRGLLEGRHDLAPDRADELVRETAQHLAATGGTAQEEFGPVEEYAVTLAQQHPAAPRWWQRPATRNWVSLGLSLSFIAWAVFGERPVWYTVVAVLLLVWSSVMVIRDLRAR